MQDITPLPQATAASRICPLRINMALARHFGEIIQYEVLENAFSRSGVIFCQEITLDVMNEVYRLLTNSNEVLNSLIIIDSENEKIRLI